MKKNCNKLALGTLLAGGLGLLITLWPAAGLGQDTGERPNAWARYEIILKRNMFSRQRGFAQRQRDNDERREVVVPNPESYLLLKGVVQEDGQFIAFLEDTRSSSVLKVRQGDRVARGVIKSLTLDAIEYEFEEQTTVIRIGQDLEGGLGAVTMNQLMEFSENSAGAPDTQQTAPAETPTGEEADILKQLMERRKQEIGG